MTRTDERVNWNPVGGEPLPPTWSQGPIGPPGPTGAQGAQGPPGQTGLTGPVGPAGPQGIQGPAGADSTVPGPAGPQGIQGPAGPQGIQGPQGAASTVPGPQGPAGVGVPTGGSTNQHLMKASNADYDFAWGTPAGGVTIPLTQNLTWTPDNTYDIGATSSTLRPRDLFLGRNLNVSGTSQFQGRVGINTTPPAGSVWLNVNGMFQSGNWALSTGPNTQNAMLVGGTMTGSGDQAGGRFVSTFDNTGATGRSVSVKWASQAVTYTLGQGASFWADPPQFGAGYSVSTFYGLGISNMGAANVANAYGVYINAQSGASTTNIGLYNAGTSQFMGPIGINAGIDSRAAININTPSFWMSDPTNSWTIKFDTMPNAAATSEAIGLRMFQQTNASGTNVNTLAAIRLVGSQKNGSSTATSCYGFLIDNQGGCAPTNAYGVYIGNQSGASNLNIGLYNAGLTRLDNHLNWQTDNTYDIGGSAAGGSRPRDLYVAGNVNLDNTTSKLVAPAGSSSSVPVRIGTSSNTGLFQPGTNMIGISTASYETLRVAYQAVTVFGALQIGTANERIRNPVNSAANLSVESADGYVMISSKLGSNLAGNAYFDGTNWMRFDVAQPVSFAAASGGVYTVYTAAAGANPIAPVSKMALDNAGNLTLAGGLSVAGAGVASFGGPMTLNTARTANQAGINFYASVGGSANDYSVFSESGNLYLWGPNGLYVQGSGGSGFRQISASAFNVNSTLRNKRNLSPLSQPASLAAVLDERVTPLAYTYLDDARYIGFTAEDMRQVVPEVVKLGDQGEPEAINYGALVPVLWSAVRELSTRLAALENA